MKKIIIIEDEIPARNKLKRLIGELDTTTEIIAELDTVEQAVDFLRKQQADVIFSDIELLDGNAFEIYKQVAVSCPIIFTTAYNQFWMDAFDGNGIAYLLKPFSKERFLKAWDKFILLGSSTAVQEDTSLTSLTKLIEQTLKSTSYKKRFTVSNSQGFYFLETENIIFFEASEGVVFGYCVKGQKHLLSETTLKEIEKQLDPICFFRINRSELINKKYIEKIARYNKNSLAVKFYGSSKYLKTSQSHTAAFRDWVEK